MSTRRLHRLVPLFAAGLLGACATVTRASLDDRAPRPSGRVTIRVDSQSRDRIHVYLLGESREWSLGAVEAGTSTWLTVPARALALGAGQVRLAAVAGGGVTMQASRDPRATISLGQPAGTVIEQRWVFTPGLLTPMR